MIEWGGVGWHVGWGDVGSGWVKLGRVRRSGVSYIFMLLPICSRCNGSLINNRKKRTLSLAHSVDRGEIEIGHERVWSV